MGAAAAAAADLARLGGAAVRVWVLCGGFCRRRQRRRREEGVVVRRGEGEEKESDADGSAVNAMAAMALSVFPLPLSLSLFVVQVQLHGLAALEPLGRWGSGVGALLSTLSLSAKLKPAFG